MANNPLGIGFGLERIGLVAKRFPVAATIFVVIVTVLAAMQIPAVRFDGNVTAVLPEESQAYRNYFAQAEAYRDFSRDVTVLVESPRLMTAQGLEDLRNLQLDIALDEQVANVVSLFSTPDVDAQTGELSSFFPDLIEDDGAATALVAQLLERFPQAGALVVPERNLTTLIITMKRAEVGGEDADESGYGGFKALEADIAKLKPDDFTVRYTGLTPIGITIVAGLVSDQLRLTLIGLGLGAFIALVVYRSLAAALICAIPPTLTAIWSLGLLGWLQLPINYLTTVLPSLALILAFADGIVLYFRWQSSNATKSDLDENMIEALHRVGPASALTSITTLLAFLSFSFAPGSALKTFSLLGMAFVTIAFLAVIVALPVACHWAIRIRMVRSGKVAVPAYRSLGALFHRFFGPRPGRIALGAIIVVGLLGIVHTQVTPEYKITDYLPAGSDAREAEAIANEVLGGRSLIFVAVPRIAGESIASRENLQRIAETEAVLETTYSPELILSLNSLAGRVDNDAARERLAEQLESPQATGNSSFVSRDGQTMLVSVRIASNQPIATTLAQIDTLRARLDELSFGKEAVITGFDVLMAREFTKLIEQLRTSLLIAIFLGVVIVGVATASPMLAIAAVTPNLLPILTVEFFIWLRGGTINMSEVIALTIAFGIAIDNAVHVINLYNSERRAGVPPGEAIRGAILEVGPALGASTTIICVASLVTQISVLPMVPILGQLMIATLIVALISNLAILPANILVLSGLKGGGNDDPSRGHGKAMHERLSADVKEAVDK